MPSASAFYRRREVQGLEVTNVTTIACPMQGFAKPYTLVGLAQESGTILLGECDCLRVRVPLPFIRNGEIGKHNKDQREYHADNNSLKSCLASEARKLVRP
jgi:hypothetical protein